MTDYNNDTDEEDDNDDDICERRLLTLRWSLRRHQGTLYRAVNTY